MNAWTNIIILHKLVYGINCPNVLADVLQTSFSEEDFYQFDRKTVSKRRTYHMEISGSYQTYQTDSKLLISHRLKQFSIKLLTILLFHLRENFISKICIFIHLPDFYSHIKNSHVGVFDNHLNFPIMIFRWTHGTPTKSFMEWQLEEILKAEMDMISQDPKHNNQISSNSPSLQWKKAGDGLGAHKARILDP